MIQPSQRYLYLTVFTAGMTTLGIELSASRLLGTVFGTSNLVWATIIGLILLYLTVGYFIGGRLADRSPQGSTFYRVIAWASFSTALVPIAARPVLQVAGQAALRINAAVLIGSFLGVLILFAVPVTLLATVSPFAIRLAIRDTDSAGLISGRMYAISTVGSLLGTFLPTLILIPLLGTNLTFLLFAGLLWTISLIGLARIDWRQAVRLLWMPVVVIVLALLMLRGPLRRVPNGAILLYEDESAYNYIQVAQWGSTNILYLNEGQGIHSVYYPDAPDYLVTGGTWDYFVIAPFFNAPPKTPQDVGSLALVGLAGGTIARQYTAVFGPIPIDGIEIDPEIIKVGRQYFGMTEPNINVIVQDGRIALAASDRRYDVVGVDAYRLPYVPWNLSTVEFFQSIRDHLTEDGVVAINVGRTVNDRRLIDAFAVTMGQVFPSVHVVDVPKSCNSIMYGTVQPTSPGHLRENLRLLPEDVHPLLRQTLETSLQQVRETPQGGTILTDDRAATELMTDLILVNFVLSGDSTLPCQ